MEQLELDDVNWRILKGLSYSPKTPQMLARIYGIPIAECWQRIRFLEGLGLIHVVLSFIGQEGRILSFYQTGDETLAIVVDEAESAHAYFEPA